MDELLEQEWIIVFFLLQNRLSPFEMMDGRIMARKIVTNKLLNSRRDWMCLQINENA